MDLFRVGKVRQNLKNACLRLAGCDAQSMSVRFFAQFIGKGDLCFDIGANVGDKTKAFLRLGARVICVEPERKCLEELKRRFANNDSVAIVEKGVAGCEGYLDLSVCKDMPNIATFSQDFRDRSIFIKEYGLRWSGVERVAVTTLDALISQFGVPGFCKIDVEGFEEEALKGLTHPLSVISFEYDDYFFPQMEECLMRLSQLGDYSFNFVVANPADGKGLALPQWVKPEALCEEIYSLKKKVARLWGDIYARLPK